MKRNHINIIIHYYVNVVIVAETDDRSIRVVIVAVQTIEAYEKCSSNNYPRWYSDSRDSIDRYVEQEELSHRKKKK
jgi:hypothetical protein